MPKNIDLITIIISLEGIDEIKAKNDEKTFWTITRVSVRAG